MALGRFITFEGGEGAGKSTQVRLLSARLAAFGHEVLTTREPGGCPNAELVRRLLLDPSNVWQPLSEALLHAAGRSEHLADVIRPALDRGAWVISDRFADSTRAYQGAGQGLDTSIVDTLRQIVVGDTMPDLTVILDCPADVGLARAAHRGHAPDRYENADLAFHERLRESFEAIALSEPARCVVIDANRPVETVAADVWTAVQHRLDPPS